MSNTASKIEIILSAVDRGLSAVFSRGEAAVSAFNQTAGNGVRAVNALDGALAGVVGAFAGMAAIRSAGDMMVRAGQAAFDMAASLQAANREFSGVGSVESWGAAIERLSRKMRVYSDSDLKSAVSRTVDMTKRLGMSAAQMERVIELTGDLSAGKTDLNGGIERVTAALRGEAEASEYLGLTLNENYVKAWYEAKGAMEGAWKDLTDMQKAQVRYQVFLEQAIPMQGRAAESANTLGGALQLVRKEIDNAVVNSVDAKSAMQQLAATFADNSEAVGSLVGTMVTAAAKTAEWLLRNQEMVVSLAEWVAKIYLAIKAVQGIGVAINIIKGLNASITALTGGNSLGKWAQAAVTDLGKVNLATTTLSGAIKSLGGVAAAAFVGWEIGTWLNQFDIVKKGALTLIHTFDMLGLSVQSAWAYLTGGDVEGVERKMSAATQAYKELIAEIDNKDKAEGQQQEGQKPTTSPAEDEKAKNEAEMARQEAIVKAMSEADAKALEEKKQKEIEAAEQAAEAKRKLDEEAAARVAAEPPPEPDPKPVEQTQQVRRVVERQTEIREEVSTRKAEAAREVEEQAAREKEEREVKADESRQQRLEAARRNAEEEAAAERELLEERAAASEQAAAEETERLEQLQADQAKAAEERMAREQAATEKAKGIFERYADRVKTLQDEIAGREQSLKDDLAEMDPNADEETKWRRRAAEAKNYEKAAKQAQAAGNLEEAQGLADKAREAYKGLGSGAAGIDERTAKQMAFAGVKSAGTLGLDLAKMLPETLKKTAQIDMSKVEGLSSQAAAMLGGRMAGMAGDAGGGTAKPTQVHEIRLGKASLQGSPADVNEFLRQLEMAGMTA